MNVLKKLKTCNVCDAEQPEHAFRKYITPSSFIIDETCRSCRGAARDSLSALAKEREHLEEMLQGFGEKRVSLGGIGRLPFHLVPPAA